MHPWEGLNRGSVSGPGVGEGAGWQTPPKSDTMRYS